ncbi:MAG: helix-turn-helix transcriptional regulator, partial [Thermaerobacter sp.]|nr:helix-turn-helix transcriptional regulator [Thermaerobacter sp.]
MQQLTQNVALHRAKMAPPQALFRVVPRQRIDAWLDAAFSGRLTLVIAPAGFGKTTAVTQWLCRSGVRCAWISLDEGDNDPVRFWTYLIGALENLSHDLGDAVHTMLRSSAPPWEAVISSLIDALETVPFDFALVLDDYHVVHDPLVHETFAFLMRYAPQRMHIMILSRYPVTLPFARLRLSGQMAELTARDLSFSGAEAKLFYQQRGVHVTDEDVDKLIGLTWGWAAGMQMTAMSLARTGNKAIALDHFEASAGRLAAYFREEVFGGFSETTQAFLMQTAILERMCGSLCEAMTGAPNGREALETIARQGGFLVCLDENESWYRYHKLFAEFLRGILRQRDPESVAALHRQAAKWFEDHGSAAEAIEHYLNGEDVDRAVRLIKKQAAGMLGRGERATLLRWLGALPDAAVESDAQLCLVQAMAGIAEGSVQRVSHWLEWAETVWPSQGAESAEFAGNAMSANRAIAHLYLAAKAQSVHDVLHWSAVAQRTQDGDSQLTYGLIFENQECSLLCGPLGWFGNLKGKARGMEGDVHLRLRGLVPPEARRGYIPVVNAEALYERNQIDAARKSLLVGIEEAQVSQSAGALVPAYVTLARVHLARGDLGAALGAAAECERQVAALGQPQWLGAIAALRVRLRMTAGDRDAAAAWLERCRVDVYDRLSADRAFEHTTLARVLLVLGRGEEAVFLLERLLATAEQEQRIPSIIEAANLLALAHSALGRAHQALDVLRTSLTLGRENGYLRIFVDEGPPMLSLLLRLHRLEGRNGPVDEADYVRSLVALLRQSPMRPQQATPPPALIEPLTAREMDVLKLVGKGLDNRSVAREIGVEL